MEPIMRLEIVTPSDHSSMILKDLGKRRAEIQYIDVRGQNKVRIGSRYEEILINDKNNN